MFSSSCYIRKNTEDLRDKLKDLGYCICLCCKFEDSMWLSIRNKHTELNGVVHGVGCVDECTHATTEDLLEDYAMTTSDIDCGENEDLFLEIAAIEDDDENKSIEKYVLTKYGAL